MKILGVDPGSHNLGWGVIDVQGSDFICLNAGTLKAPEGALEERLVFFEKSLESILERYQPVLGVVEAMFHAKNSHSAIVLAHARGIALCTLKRAGLEIEEYSPTQIKQSVVGSGRASKEQVGHMVKLLLHLRDPLGLDASDALAAALCAANHQGFKRLQQGVLGA